jgi:hypothetical protein
LQDTCRKFLRKEDMCRNILNFINHKLPYQLCWHQLDQMQSLHLRQDTNKGNLSSPVQWRKIYRGKRHTKTVNILCFTFSTMHNLIFPIPKSPHGALNIHIGEWPAKQDESKKPMQLWKGIGIWTFDKGC